jgi:iron(III) transport system substrate-binding protein
MSSSSNRATSQLSAAAIFCVTLGLMPLPASAQQNAALPPEIVQLAQKAKAEGQIVLYSSTGEEILQDLKTGFEKQFGVALNYIRIVTGPQIEKIRQELAAGAVQLDIYDNGDPAFSKDMADKGVLQPVGDLPIPPGFPKENVTKFCVQGQQFAHSIGYNTRLVSKAAAPKTWTDLLSPQWKGQIGVVNPRVGAGIQSWWYVMAEKLGPDFFTKLAAQNVRIYDDIGSIANDLASGAIAFQIPAWPYGVQSLVDSGAPVSAVYPSPTSGVASMDCQMAASRHPSAGKLFLWYVMSKAGQTALNGKHRGNSPVAGIEGSEVLPPDTTFPEPNAVVAARTKLFELADKTASGGK